MTDMLSPSDLFSLPAPRILTAPPAMDFLYAIADGLADALDLGANPAALSEAMVFTPNRRAGRVMAEAFHQAALNRGINALIAPDIRVLGDLEDDNTIAPIGISELELGPPLSEAERRGTLALLVQQWRTKQDAHPLPPSSALAAADELSSLLDQAAMGEGVDWSRLPQLVENADLAVHWQKSTSFLEIIGSAWPDHLKEQGATDPMARRVAAARALANQWDAAPPDHPVVIVGSTGATPATRLLMQSALTLPRGLVVLPGLDMDVADDAWSAIGKSPSHPQHTLHRALDRLSISRRDVRTWPGIVETPASQARRKLLNEALAPASATSSWTRRLEALAKPGTPTDLVRDGLEGLSLVEADDESEEALAAALMLRETLDTPGRTAALVTPDPGLARRVSALLKRWDIHLTPSAGTPFLQTPHGALVALVFDWLRDPGDPVQLMALLKHPFVSLGRDAETRKAALSDLEVHSDEYREKAVLRGPRRFQGLPDLADRLERRGRSLASALIADLHDHLIETDLVDMPEMMDAPQHIRRCAVLLERLCNSPDMPGDQLLWRGAEGGQTARFLETLEEIVRHMLPDRLMAADLWPEFASAAAARIAVAPKRGEHPRLAIWGPLEARLQTRDLIILGSLNEGAWPAPAPADSFLPRHLRRELGLPDPEERLGLSAHDFAQLACSSEVVLLRSMRVDDKPAVASRWLWRLRTLASGGIDRDGTDSLDEIDRMLAPAPDRDPLVWARQLRHIDKVEAAQPPAPTPPADKRPTRFSVSRVTALVRDPYHVYAQTILKLNKLPALGEEVNPAARGTAIHEAVDKFSKPDNTTDLLDLILSELAIAGAPPAEIQLQRALWARAADAYHRWIERRSKRVKHSIQEKEAVLDVPVGDTLYKLTAKADRIELLNDGTLAIIDFKTGAPKTKKQLESGLEPQLPLEAWIARQLGFPGLPAADTSELVYVSLAPGASTIDPKNGEPLDVDAMAEAQKAFEGFLQLVRAYEDPEQPYRSKPRVEFTWTVSDYDRLARRAEWTSDDGGEA